jgi:hypothetical protein
VKKQLVERNFIEEEELFSVLYEPMSEIPSDMILRVFDDWDRWLRRHLLMERESVEEIFNLK